MEEWTGSSPRHWQGGKKTFDNIQVRLKPYRPVRRLFPPATQSQQESPRSHIRLTAPTKHRTPPQGVRKLASPIPKEKRNTGRVYMKDGTGFEAPFRSSAQTVFSRGVAQSVLNQSFDVLVPDRLAQRKQKIYESTYRARLDKRNPGGNVYQSPEKSTNFFQDEGHAVGSSWMPRRVTLSLLEKTQDYNVVGSWSELSPRARIIWHEKLKKEKIEAELQEVLDLDDWVGD